MTAAAPRSGRPAPGRGPILVVDGDPVFRAALRRGLEVAAGVGAREASDGVEALGAIALGGFGLVVADLETPRLSGFALLAACRRSAVPALADLPFVLVTKRAEPGIEAQAIALGATLFLRKPLHAPDLEVIRNAHAGR